MSLRPPLDFLLYDWLQVADLTERARFAEHSRETFDAVLDTCERIARDKYAPFNRTVDLQEPHFDGEKVTLPQATQDAYNAYAASGMLSAGQDYDLGGMQLPYTVEAAANAFFAMASISISSSLLSVGNANLLMAYGTPTQKKVFALNQFSGRFAGTMCLSEPQAGSSLSDITTRAVADGDGFETDPLGHRYRLKGHKMWISAGDHELSDNIVHLVLAKIPGPDGKLVPGTRGISLFIVPKKLVNAHGQLTGERNDVALAGLNHKLGWRGTTNTLLNFGEGKYLPQGQDGAIGYLVGAPGKGLACMFHMMNEARIGIGMAATMLGMAGYHASLDYAKDRPQGRALQTAAAGSSGGKDAAQPQVRIIAHADVRRMLLAQKSYAEGALALNLYCAHLVDAQHTAAPAAADEARLLLEVLTPIAKSWPSEWCLEANSLAIQVHGGYGYTRDFAVEQYWRDNRLNMIHEGTHGIQALDLLGRKVLMEGGRGLALLAARVRATVVRSAAPPTDASGSTPEAQALRNYGLALEDALQQVLHATEAAWATSQPQEALANAVPYMQAFGHMVLAWIWLDVALACTPLTGPGHAAPSATHLVAAHAGRMGACSYFYRYELPKIKAWLNVVVTRDLTCANLPEEAF